MKYLSIKDYRLSSVANKFILVLLIYLISPNIEILSIPFGDFVFFILFFSLLLNNNFNKANTKTKVILFVPLIAVSLSIFSRSIIELNFSIDSIRNVINIFKLCLLSFISYQIVKNNFDETNQFIAKITFVVAISCIFIDAIGLMQFFNIGFLNNIISTLYEETDYLGMTNFERFSVSSRVVGIFPWANSLAAFLAFTTMLLIILRKYTNSLIFYLVLVMNIAVLILTNGRASIIVLVFMLAVYFILERRYLFVGFFLILGFLTFTLLFDFLPKDSVNRFYEIQTYIQTGSLPYTLEYRFSLVPMIYYFVTESFISFLFGMEVVEFRKSLISSWEIQYLGWFIKYGIVGLIILIFWIIFLIKKSISFRYYDVGILLFILFVGMLTISFSQDIFFLARWRELYFAFIGIFLAVIQRKE